MTAPASTNEDHFVLRDGTDVVVRPMTADDAERLVRFHEGLSPETTRLRFFNVHPHLSTREVGWFTGVDHHDREALVAVHGDEIIAVGRFDRLASSSEAEVAFVVADAWQGKGIATELFRRLAERARMDGLERLVAQTLGENHQMLRVFRGAGLPITTTWEHGVVNVVMWLTDNEGESDALG